MSNSNRTNRSSFAGPVDLEADSSTSCISAFTNARPAKRRRATGLNSRFDHMIERVNVMHSYGSSSPATLRRRMRSSGTSSVSSYGVPKTPVDAHSRPHHQRKLGEEFSVLKMNRSPNSALRTSERTFLRQDSNEYPELAAAPTKAPKNPLPDWLVDTLCTLGTEHPLRGLLSPSRSKTELLPVEPLNSPHEEQVRLSEQTRGGPTCYLRTRHAMQLRDSSIGGIRIAPDSLPFSTPGYFSEERESLENLHVDPISPLPRFQHQGRLEAHPDISSRVNFAPLPSSQLLPYDAVKRSWFTRESIAFTPGTSGRQPNRTSSSILSRESQRPEGNIDHYVTPGPDFTCSRPVYFDSPTEDPSFSDPLGPEAYELDLDNIDFRWRPFLRSNTQNGQANHQADRASRPQSFGFSVSGDTADQDPRKTQIAVAHTGLDAPTEGRLASPLLEDIEEAYLVFSPNAMQEAGLITRQGAVNETIRSSSRSPLVNENKEAEPGIFTSPLPDRRGSIDMVVGVQPRVDEENIAIYKEPSVVSNQVMSKPGSVGNLRFIYAAFCKAAPRRSASAGGFTLQNEAVNTYEADTNVTACHTSEGQIESASLRASTA
ncbi:hypothetical protein BU15DRAFT_71251 [Melanogaster broomeanus]|nr:hypothetical protein BU15DRAFT_71251 [Melanogaster broomeanus]